jgi:hypothetical protein
MFKRIQGTITEFKNCELPNYQPLKNLKIVIYLIPIPLKLINPKKSLQIFNFF